MGEGQSEPIDTVYPKDIHRYVPAKKKPQPIWVEVYFWWRRRELYFDYKLLINITLMGLENCFCYILCYMKLSISTL